MPEAFINIGSNLGDRAALIERAVADIEALPGISDLRRDKPIESEPWGYDSTNPFLNLGITLSTSMNAEELFMHLRDIERSISVTPHRKADGSYADRPIDIDLIAFGNVVCSTDYLTLPHPRMHLRSFVLEPISRMNPGWIHPLLNQSAAQMLASLRGQSSCRHTTDNPSPAL